MSSRRKSRPVRRLDIPSAATDLQGDVQFQQSTPDYQQSEQSLSPPCESPQDNNVFVNSEGRDSNSDEEKDNAVDSKIKDAKKRLENPPEGVYIVQPQGVSDDEGGQEVKSMVTKPQHYVTEGQGIGEPAKKRQLERERGFLSEFHDDRKRDGLDLSVKKRRFDTDSHGNAEEMTSAFDQDEEANEDLSALEFQEIVPRYEKLLQSLSQRHSLAESMQEVGLTQKDIVTYQRFRMQMLGNPQGGNEATQAEEGYQVKQEETDSNTHWEGRSHNGAAGEAWQGKREYTDEDNLHKTPFSASNLPVVPAVVAAMMAATLASNNGRNDESPSKSEVLQNMFKRSQIISQMSSSPKTPSTGQYATSADAMDTITAGTVSSGVGSIKKGTLDPTNFDEDVFDKYISRYSSKNSCMQPSCPHINRDHFHCTDSDCNFQRFTNKSDVIRHYNMHKKRDNSLAHGFMRFAPTDSCVSQFGACHLNGKSTHYHCLHPNCTKVYTSTSDVMTHENFHKKNQHFVTNGFQRYRATETCGTGYCPFKDQRTTHFHCTRNDCNFTFKNKCDIEKHKSYHMRDDAYARQGFKKFYKNEPCQFLSCAWNRTANHFHCLRKNCDFSFTSTSQMVSHKRKHDRQDLMGAERTSLSPMAGLGTESRSFVFNDAASKVLASIPTPVGAAPPRSTSNFSPKLDHPSLQAVAFNPISTSSAATTSEPEVGYRSRGESRTDWAAEYDRPPPPYMEVPENMSNRNSPRYENERYHGDSGASDAERWGVTSQHSRVSPEAKNLQAYKEDNDNGDSQALNLSGKSKLDQIPLNRATSVPDAGENPSPSVLKFFRGFVPEECVVPNCIFLSRHHFHCVVQDCCAVFADKILVLNHTVFHDKLEKMGFPQNNAKQFPRRFPPTSRSASSRDANSPPPGYIALPVSSRPKETYPERSYEFDRRNAFFSRLNFESEQTSENRDNLRQDARETTQAEAKNIFNPENLKEKQAISSHDARNTSIFDYISRKVAESRATSTHPTLQNVPPMSSSAYVMLQNPSIIASIVGNNQKSLLPQGNNTSEQNDSMKRCNSNAAPAVDGYIHVRAGMACLRADCKYVLQNHWHCTLNRCRYVCKSQAKAQSHREAHDSLEAYARAAKECFRSYTVKKNCPNPNCEFRLRGHYHCLKPGCQFVTIGTSKLPWHMKKHEKIARREAKGFKYYTKKEQCGKLDCKYSDRFSHYHCVRAGCAFAFQYKHQMSTHVRKHLRRMLGRSYSGPDMAMEVGGNIDHSNVDSGDDSLPLIVDEADELEQRPGVSMETARPSLFQPRAGSNSGNELSPEQQAVLDRISKGIKTSLAPTSGEQAITVGQMRGSLSENEFMHDDDNIDDVGDDSSNDEVLDLRAGNAPDSDSNSISSSELDPNNEQHFMMLDNEKTEIDEAAVPQTAATEEADMSGYNSSKSADRTPESGAMFNKFRLNNDVMAGFKRFEISENCGDAQCNFGFKVSHYHCMQDDCNYRFTGRTHMFKHQQHHERVAGLVRDDFKRFKPTHDCEQSECPHNGNATHFHCLRCDFKCTDSAKVGTHRRQHVKADTLEQSGFERFRGKEDCQRDNCKYRDRNTSHFHCLQEGCSYAVVGLTSIEQHYKKHQRNMNGQPNAQVNFSIFAKHLISQADSSSNFAASSLSGNSAHVGSYSVPFSALPSTPAAAIRCSDGLSPVMDERSSVSPSFTSSIVTTQFVDSGLIQNKQEQESMDLSSPRDLSVSHDMQGSGLNGLQAGISS